MKKLWVICSLFCFLIGCSVAGELVVKNINEGIAKDNLKTTRADIPQFTKKIIEKGPYKIEIENMWREEGKRYDHICFDVKVKNIGEKEILISASDFTLTLESGNSLIDSSTGGDETNFGSYKNKVGQTLFPGVEKKGIIKMRVLKQDIPKRLDISSFGGDANYKMAIELP